jgi:DNA-directed RNA polymerase specialized sigma24 family protein
MSVSDDAEWARVVAGEGDALVRIFDLHRDRVRRHAMGLAPSHSEAEDVVSLTFLEAWRKRGTIRFVDQSILPWLLGTATYTCLNMARSEKRHRFARMYRSTSHGNCQTRDRYEGEGSANARLVAASDQGVARLFQQGSSSFVICRLHHQNVPVERRDDEYSAPRR